MVCVQGQDLSGLPESAVGLAVHLGCGDGQLTMALQTGESGLVHGLDTNAAIIQQARETISAAGKQGRVSVADYDGQFLPYADNIVNRLVISDIARVGKQEIMRVLVPNGEAFLAKDGAWQRIVKPWPQDMGQWPHHLHGADGNPVTPDKHVGPPKQMQWLAGPKWQRAHDTDANVNALVSAGGRVFYMVDEAPIGLPGANGLPDKWMLAARDAFNGILLWKLPVEKWGWREYKDSHYRTRHDLIPVNVHRRVVATSDDVYATLGMGAPVSRLDAATGKVQHTYAGTDGTREILLDNGELLLTVPGESGLALSAIDASTGKANWATKAAFAGTAKETGRLKVEKQTVLNAAADGDSVCLIDGGSIVCLDRKTGKERWRTKPEVKSEELWAGTLIVKDGVILYAEQGVVLALSAKDGKSLWRREEKLPGGLWFSWKDVFVIDGLVWTWGPVPGRRQPVSEAHGLDLQTGKLEKRIPLGPIFKVDHHHRCYRNKATSQFIIASRRGAEFVDLTGGSHSVNNWVRGICHLGMMPANGLLYAPPEPCKCYWYERISDFCALAPKQASGERDPSLAEAVPGPAAGKADGPKAGSHDWRTFRADTERSGSTKSRLPEETALAWESDLKGRLSAPVAVGDMAFVAAIDAHTVHALDAATGREKWRHTVGGRVDSPPTYAQGKVVFGSADGWVTCLRATDGEVAWRFRAAPRERLVGAYNQLESAWPVHGSLLVLDNTVYCAAGRSSYLDGGLHLYGLNLDTGQVVHRAQIEGPEVDLDNEDWFSNYNDIGGRGALADILQAVEGGIAMRNRLFNHDLQLSSNPMPPHLQPMGGFLDDTYFKRYYWFYGSSMVRQVYAAMAKPTINAEQMSVALAQLLVQDDDAIYGLRMYDMMKLLNANNYFVPGKDGYLLFKVPPGQGEPDWQVRVPIRVTAMAATPDQLAIAGAPDIVDPADPLGAFEARKGGKLRLVSTTDGSTKQEHDLDSPPVFNGIAVANGRMFVSLKNGRMACFAAPK